MPTKSTSSSVSTRAARRSVSIRSRKESAGGRLRRTSADGSTTGGVGDATTRGPAPRFGGSWVCDRASANDGSARLNAVRVRLYRGLQCWHVSVGAAGHAKPCGLRRAGSREGLDARVLQRARKSLTKLDLRLPVELLACERDVGLANLRIVDRERLVDDLRPRARHVDDLARELEQRELLRVADVDRLG